jgi:hypothetical protein
MDTKDLKGNKAQFDRKDYLDIKEIMEEYGLSDMRVRTCIRNKTLKSILIFVGQTKTQQHICHKNDVIAWRNKSNQHTKRNDGRNKYNVYCTPSEKVMLDQLMLDNKIQLPIGLANSKKIGQE